MVLTYFCSTREKNSNEFASVFLSDLKGSTNVDSRIEVISKSFLKSRCLQTLKLGMEFMFVHNQFRSLQQLIIKNKHTKNKENIEWAEVYQLMLNIHYRKSTFFELMNKIQQFETQDPTVKTLLEFSKLMVYNNMKDYKFLGESIDKINKFVESIQDVFLVSCFRRRIDQVMFYYYRSRNELILARKISYQLLEVPLDARTRAWIHSSLAFTYLFDTYEQGIYHLDLALKITKKHKIKEHYYHLCHYSIPFYSAHFGETKNLESDAKCQQAHIEIQRGNKDKAIKLLSEIQLINPFQYYFLGLATEDINILNQSYHMFLNERNDYFHSRLPLYAIKKA